MSDEALGRLFGPGSGLSLLVRSAQLPSPFRMPTYEYRCPEGHEFEKFYRTISAAESTVACPTCGQPATRQLSAGAGLMFKGSGFYLTDYGKNAHSTRGPSKPAAKSDTASAPASETKSSGTSEPSAGGAAKPAPAPPTKPSVE